VLRAVRAAEQLARCRGQSAEARASGGVRRQENEAAPVAVQEQLAGAQVRRQACGGVWLGRSGQALAQQVRQQSEGGEQEAGNTGAEHCCRALHTLRSREAVLSVQR